MIASAPSAVLIFARCGSPLGTTKHGPEPSNHPLDRHFLRTEPQSFLDQPEQPSPPTNPGLDHHFDHDRNKLQPDRLLHMLHPDQVPM